MGTRPASRGEGTTAEGPQTGEAGSQKEPLMWTYMVFQNMDTGELHCFISNYGITLFKVRVSEAWVNAQIYGDEYGSEE